MKKILTIALVLVMLSICALPVFAAEKALPDLDCAGWWTAHSEGIEVTAEGVEITFTNTSYEAAASNWNCPIYILYTGEEAKVNGAGYVEYWVTRGDAYGWGNAACFGVTGDLNTDVNNAAAVANMAAAGITFSSTGIDGWVGWENFVAALKAGGPVKITAKLVDGKAHVVFEINGLQSTLDMPVDTTKPVYLSLSGEMTNLTNIVVKTPDAPNPNDPPVTGDMMGVVVALMAISGTALVVLKKKH